MGARKEERKKKKKTAEKVPNRGGHLSLNVENVKDEKKKKREQIGERRESSSYTEQLPVFVA